MNAENSADPPASAAPEVRRFSDAAARAFADAGVDVLFCTKSVSDRVSGYLAKEGVLAFKNVKQSDARAIARATGASVHLQRIVRPDVDSTQERSALVREVGYIVREFNPVLYHVDRAENVSSGIQTRLDSEAYDLVIIGASHEWSIRQAVFGTIPDVVADRAYCSVLMVRRYVPQDWSVRAATRLKRIKEAVGLTTSPEEGTA